MNFKINLQSSREKLLFTLLTIKKKMFSTICLDLYAIFNEAQPFLFFFIDCFPHDMTNSSHTEPMKIPRKLGTVRI